MLHAVLPKTPETHLKYQVVTAETPFSVKVSTIRTRQDLRREFRILLGRQICHQSIVRTQIYIDTLYTNCGSRLLRFTDIAGFVSQIPLLVTLPRLSLKIWR